MSPDADHYGGSAPTAKPGHTDWCTPFAVLNVLLSAFGGAAAADRFRRRLSNVFPHRSIEPTRVPLFRRRSFVCGQRCRTGVDAIGSVTIAADLAGAPMRDLRSCGARGSHTAADGLSTLRRARSCLFGELVGGKPDTRRRRNVFAAVPWPIRASHGRLASTASRAGYVDLVVRDGPAARKMATS